MIGINYIDVLVVQSNRNSYLASGGEVFEAAFTGWIRGFTGTHARFGLPDYKCLHIFVCCLSFRNAKAITTQGVYTFVFDAYARSESGFFDLHAIW